MSLSCKKNQVFPQLKILFICGARRLLHARPERTEKHFRRHSGSLWQRDASGNTHLQGNILSCAVTNNLFSLNFPHKQLSTPDISKPTHYTTWNVLLTYCDFTNNTRRGLTSTNSLTRPSSIITHLFNAFSLSFFLCQSLFLWLSGRNVWGEAGLFASVGLLWWLGHSPSPPLSAWARMVCVSTFCMAFMWIFKCMCAAPCICGSNPH